MHIRVWPSTLWLPLGSMCTGMHALEHREKNKRYAWKKNLALLVGLSSPFTRFSHSLLFVQLPRPITLTYVLTCRPTFEHLTHPSSRSVRRAQIFGQVSFHSYDVELRHFSLKTTCTLISKWTKSIQKLYQSYLFDYYPADSLSHYKLNAVFSSLIADR